MAENVIHAHALGSVSHQDVVMVERLALLIVGLPGIGGLVGGVVGGVRRPGQAGVGVATGGLLGAVAVLVFVTVKLLQALSHLQFAF